MCYRLIGEKVNLTDHATVMHGIKRMKGLIESDDIEISRYAKEINIRIAHQDRAAKGWVIKIFTPF
jgi:chromosomal replication initiation ATPase DnaA